VFHGQKQLISKRIPFENLIFSETFKITGLGSKPYAIREWNALLFDEDIFIKELSLG
jgi:hypothetical protein